MTWNCVISHCVFINRQSVFDALESAFKPSQECRPFCTDHTFIACYQYDNVRMFSDTVISFFIPRYNTVYLAPFEPGLFLLSNFTIFTLSVTMIKFLPLDFLGVSYRILWKNETAINRLQVPALVPEIFKFEKCKVCKWDEWRCHTLNPILHHVYK